MHVSFEKIQSDLIVVLLVKDIVLKSILSAKAGLQKEYEEVLTFTFFQDIVEVFVNLIVLIKR